MSVVQDVYQELILQHSRHPRHYGELPAATHSAVGDNPLCGDRYEVHLQVDASGQIRDAAFEGVGCAISKASASLMLDAVIGMSQMQFEQLFHDFQQVIRGEDGAAEARGRIGKLAAFAGIWKYPARVKCAMLSWHALRNAWDARSAAPTENPGQSVGSRPRRFSL